MQLAHVGNPEGQHLVGLQRTALCAGSVSGSANNQCLIMPRVCMQFTFLAEASSSLMLASSLRLCQGLLRGLLWQLHHLQHLLKRTHNDADSSVWDCSWRVWATRGAAPGGAPQSCSGRTTALRMCRLAPSPCWSLSTPRAGPCWATPSDAASCGSSTLCRQALYTCMMRLLVNVASYARLHLQA